MGSDSGAGSVAAREMTLKGCVLCIFKQQNRWLSQRGAADYRITGLFHICKKSIVHIAPQAQWPVSGSFANPAEQVQVRSLQSCQSGVIVPLCTVLSNWGRKWF